MGNCSSFNPKNITRYCLPPKSKADHPFAININFSVLLEKDEDLKLFQNEKMNLMVLALNQSFNEKHTSQKISNFYKDYTLNQYYMDFLLTETEFQDLLDKDIDLHLFFYNEKFYFEKKTKLYIRSEAKDGFISDDELIELELIKGYSLFKNTKKKIKIGVKYRLYGDFIYNYILEDQKKFLSFYKFFEFLSYSEHSLLEEYYDKNIKLLNPILKNFRSQSNPSQADNEYFNQEFNNALDSLFTFYYKKNLRVKSDENINRDDLFLNTYKYVSAGEPELNDDLNLLTEKKLLDKEENERILDNNKLGLKETNLKMDFGKSLGKTNKNQININLINEHNIDEYELNPEKENIEFIDYETLLTKAFYKHDPIKQENSRNIQYNMIHFARKHLFDLFQVIWRDYRSNGLKENFLEENLYNILYIASAGNHKMLNLFDFIFKNELLFQIYENNMNFNNIMSLLRNSQIKDEVSKNDIFPFLLLAPKSREIIIDPNNFEEIKKNLIHHKTGQAKLDLIELLSTKPNLIFEMLNCSSNFESNHSRLFNLFAYILTIRDILELLCFNKNIGIKGDIGNENIYEIISNIEINYNKITLIDIDDKGIRNNRKIDFNFILSFCDKNYFEKTNSQVFSLFDNFRNDLFLNNAEDCLEFINKNLNKFIKLVFKFTKIPITNLERLFDKTLLLSFSELIYSQFNLLDYEEINYFLENKFEFTVDALFKGELSEAAVRKIVIVILNDENAFTVGSTKKPLQFILEENGDAAYKKNQGETEYLNHFSQFVDKNYVEEFIKSKVLSQEKAHFPFYVLSCVSKIEGFLTLIAQNLGEWKDLFYRNSSFEKFYEINFFEEYKKISYLSLLTNSIYANEFQSNTNFNNIANAEYKSEKENDIELNDIRVVSKESFSFNHASNIPILLKEKNNNPFHPCFIFLQQPKEEVDSNVKSALFLSGKGPALPNDAVTRMLSLIEDAKDYTKVNYGELKFLGCLEFDKIKKGMYKELRCENNELADFVLVILISNFENEIILTTGPFGCFGSLNSEEKDYIAGNEYKYLKDKFLYDEL